MSCLTQLSENERQGHPFSPKVSMETHTYSWTRFWQPRGDDVKWDIQGFLTDPVSEYGETLNPHAKPLGHFENYSCLILLGEPGMGKSTELSSHRDKVSESEGNADYVLRFELSTFGDQSSFSEIFHSEEFKNWKTSDSRLFLYLDGLDEARLQIPNVANILKSELRNLAKFRDRLKLRITCRTADWPTSLDSVCHQIWDKGEVVALELLPLRGIDVKEAATKNGLAAEDFLDQVLELEVQAFASRPITLDFLLKTFRKDLRLPTSRLSLYEQGCLELCEEFSNFRAESQQKGNLSARQRFAIACRIAVFVIFCRIPTIQRPMAGRQTIDSLRVFDFAGGFEEFDGERVEVSEAHIHETLQSALFTGSTDNHIEFAHATYSDFLAAKYLQTHDYSEQQILNLILHPEDDTAIIPQLGSTIAWLASMVDIFDLMVQRAPQVMLFAEKDAYDHEQRSSLVTSLIRAYREELIDDSDWGIWHKYVSLDHPGLLDQVLPLINDEHASRMLRRFAIYVARACELSGASPALCQLALDQTQDRHLRRQAINAAAIIEDVDTLKTLIPLATSSEAADDEEELRGTALEALWPLRLIDAPTLFNTLTQPRRSNHTGAYKMFLFYLEETLEVDELPDAMRWCIARVKDATQPVDIIHDRLMQGILKKVLQNLDQEELFNLLIEYAVFVLNLHLCLIENEDCSFWLNDTNRRRLVRSVFPRLKAGCRLGFGMCNSHGGLVKRGDLHWLLDMTINCTEEHLKEEWAELTKQIFRWTESELTPEIFDKIKQSEVLTRHFQRFIGSDPLVYEEAVANLENYRKQLEQSDAELEKQSRTEVDESPPSIVSQIREAIKNDTMEPGLRFETAIRIFVSDMREGWQLKASPTHCAAWSELNPEEQLAIVEDAKQYIQCFRRNEDIPMFSEHYPPAGFVTFQAATILLEMDADFLPIVSDEQWEAIAPSLITMPGPRMWGQEGNSLQRQIIRYAYNHVPETLLELLQQKVIELDVKSMPQDIVLKRLADCWDEVVSETLWKQIQQDNLSPRAVIQIILELLRHQYQPAKEWTIDAIVSSSEPRFKDHLPVLTGDLLAISTDNDFERLYPTLQADSQFTLESFRYSDNAEMSRAQLSEASISKLIGLITTALQSVPHEFDGDRIEMQRDRLAGNLSRRGTKESIRVIQDLATEFPDISRFKYDLRNAKKSHLEQSSPPLTVREMREIVQNQNSRMIRSNVELSRVVLESLERLQTLLIGDTPAVRDLWDRTLKKVDEKFWWHPVSEDEFSDYVKRHLEADLGNAGIISLREVKISSGLVEPGERTDIYIAAVIRPEGEVTPYIFHVVIETKGSWHAELKDAMRTQLHDRYMARGYDHGIYLVGWFRCKDWHHDDKRREKHKSLTLATLRAKLNTQARRLSDNSNRVQAFVMDASLTKDTTA